MRTEGKHSWRGALIMMAALVALVIATYAWLNWRTGRALQAQLDRLKAVGIPLTMAEVAPPPVPDEENAALLYLEAFRHLRHKEAFDEAYQQWWGNRRKPAGARSLERLRPLLEANREAIEAAERAARRRTSRLPIDWANWDTVWGDLPTSEFRFLAYLFSAQAGLQSADGEVEAAVESCLSGMTVAYHVSEEPSLLLQLVSHSMQRLVLAELMRVLEEHEVPQETCAAAFRALADFHLSPPLQRSLEANIAEGLATFDYYETHGSGELSSGWAFSDFPPRRWLFALYLSPLGEPIRRTERLEYLRLSSEVVELARHPYREVHAQVERIDEEADRPAPSHFILRMVFLSTQMITVRDRAQTLINAAQVALALEAYHAKHGAYPDSLDALRGHPGWKLPDDPFSGKPFVYRRQGQGFILYSWGEDLDDDGGRPAARGYREDGDMVWPFAK